MLGEGGSVSSLSSRASFATGHFIKTVVWVLMVSHKAVLASMNIQDSGHGPVVCEGCIFTDENDEVSGRFVPLLEPL